MDAKLKLNMYRLMVTIRDFEYATWDLYTQGLMPGLAHLYIGEEAVAVGACAALNPDDYITSTHRGHGHLIAKGGDLKYMMAEILGKRTGYCKGKGGSMHIADLDLGILGANGIVGGGLPIAVGAALSAKMRKTKQVTVCFFGDGASNQGTFHESLNMASIWKLPVIFVCENNLYGISLAQSRHQNIKDVADRAVAYGIPGEVVDGNDVLAVYRSVKAAAERARNGGGPTLIECKTYRWGGHHVGDPNMGALYRPKEEMEEWKQRCPIKRFRQHLIETGVATAEELDAIDVECKRAVEAAVEFAKASPYPEPAELFEDVFYEEWG
ncbi:MAG: thiamine pyrophosphate-dependent dehydrogenase E1 component subunit alpha [Bacillota bacterium]